MEFENGKSVKIIIPGRQKVEGIDADAPFFISPIQHSTKSCNECDEVYSPLVYQSKKIVYAQHLHPRQGGIYFHRRGILTDNAWLALITPLGSTYGVGTNQGRAEAASVEDIVGYCYPCDKVLTEGVVAWSRYNPSYGGYRPYCSLSEHPDIQRSIVLQFFTDKGQIVFSNP